MTKNRYESMVATYKQRRAELKKKDIVKYADNIRWITRKISNWNLTIRLIGKRDAVIKKMINDINNYFQVNIKSRKLDTQHKLARNVFYKFGMESNIRGAYLSIALGRKTTKGAAKCRMNFTRSFKTNPKNKEAYANFKNYQSDKTIILTGKKLTA